MTRKPPSRSPRDEHESARADEHPDLRAAGHQAITPGASAAPSEGQSNKEGMYQAGYGRPPLHSRFKPGQSGNPKGRPRQSRNMRTIVKQVLSEDMHIREGGRLRRMSAMEALVRTILARSFKGDVRALASLMVLLRQSGLMENDETIADLLHGPEYDAIIADFLARNGIEDAVSDEAFKASASTNATPAKRAGQRTPMEKGAFRFQPVVLMGYGCLRGICPRAYGQLRHFAKW
jgi:hypothetical protein